MHSPPSHHIPHPLLRHLCCPAVHWIFKNKDHGKTSATASLGLIYLWDVEGGLAVIDKYMYSSDQAVVAGALLGIGVVNCGVQNENDPGGSGCRAAWEAYTRRRQQGCLRTPRQRMNKSSTVVGGAGA
jgi:hypothetical protein